MTLSGCTSGMANDTNNSLMDYQLAQFHRFLFLVKATRLQLGCHSMRGREGKQECISIKLQHQFVLVLLKYPHVSRSQQMLAPRKRAGNYELIQKSNEVVAHLQEICTLRLLRKCVFQPIHV